MRICCITILAFFIFSCEEQRKPSTSENSIPKPSGYKILSQDSLGTFKRVLNIELVKEVSKEELKKIAFYLKGNLKQKYERVYMFYTLPGMQKEVDMWATTHFEGDSCEINIPKKARLTSVIPKESIIGQWQGDASVGGVKLTLYKKDGQFMLRSIHRDGSSGEEKIIQRLESGKTRYDIVGNTFGEYYILEADGSLGLYSKEGKFADHRKI